ncbi:MAG TPA: glutamate--tRNA ligase family protein [Myxococcota bacterium]|nr:glutamate--tRNA ligase family protein [Myxococcota bacterium]
MTCAIGRFAPSTTGRAHPGTLLAALLCWLDARCPGGRLILRLEDLDPERSRAELVAGLQEDLAWFGLDFDEVQLQSTARARHEAALDQLAASGLLYPCACSRAALRARGEAAPDGGFTYPGTCRERALPTDGWRASREPLRVRVPAREVVVLDESGAVWALDPARAFGDPVVRRRDGAIAYHLASVVDDAASGVTRVVRGRDLALHTPLQVALRELLGLPVPAFRHHLLLLEPRGGKLAKLHGAVAAPELRAHYSPEALCGVLAHACDLRPSADPVTPRELLPEFDWKRVRTEDVAMRWTGRELAIDHSLTRT